MLPRIFIGANRVAISRPGYDVFGAINSVTMAMDTSFTGIERPLLAGTILNRTINSSPSVGFGPFAKPPHVMVTRKHPGTNTYYHSPARSNGGGGAYQNEFQVFVAVNYFQIRTPFFALFADPDWDTAYDWCYIVMAADPYIG